MGKILIGLSGPLLLGVLFFCLVASSFYLFNPEASWNLLLESLEIPAPETQPALAIEPIHQFFLRLDEAERNIYLYYEGFVDTLFFLSVTGFSFCLIGLVLKTPLGTPNWRKYLIFLPIALLAFELVEGATLLTIMFLSPNYNELLLMTSDIATAGKLLTYLLVLLVDIFAMLVLVVRFTRSALEH